MCYAAGMTNLLDARNIRILDYPRFAEPLRERIREAAQALGTAQGARLEHVAKTHIRKEDLVAAVLKERGDHPGLVHVLSAMEACDAYEPWHDKQRHQTFLRHSASPAARAAASRIHHPRHSPWRPDPILAPDLAGTITRQLWRLRQFSLIKKVFMAIAAS